MKDEANKVKSHPIGWPGLDVRAVRISNSFQSSAYESCWVPSDRMSSFRYNYLHELVAPG